MPFNLNNSWTDNDVASLLGSVQDDRNWLLVIEKTGEVHLVDVSNGPIPSNLHGRLETWLEGNGYVGPEAAADKRHVKDTAETLHENWPNLKGDEYIDH